MTIAADERLVIDASVAVKWVIHEADSNLAEGLIGRELVAPDLLFAECANALWKKVLRQELTPEEAEIAARGLEQAPLEVVSTRVFVGRATAIATELEHPAYDGVYLAVAEAYELRLVTVDARLLRRLRRGPARLRRLLVALSDIV